MGVASRLGDADSQNSRMVKDLVQTATKKK